MPTKTSDDDHFTARCGACGELFESSELVETITMFEAHPCSDIGADYENG